MTYDPNSLTPEYVSPQVPFFLNSYATIHIGDYHDDLFFEDANGETLSLPIRIPVHSSMSGDLVVYSSSDGQEWEYHGEAAFVSGTDGMYIEFYTNHLTFFAVGPLVGDFSIENDVAVVYQRHVRATTSYTPSGGVVLDEMRLAPTFADLSSALWQAYSPSLAYVLDIQM